MHKLNITSGDWGYYIDQYNDVAFFSYDKESGVNKKILGSFHIFKDMKYSHNEDDFIAIASVPEFIDVYEKAKYALNSLNMDALELQYCKPFNDLKNAIDRLEGKT